MKKPTGPSAKMQIPLMFAFRDAFEKRDAAKVEDVRDGGERVLSKRGALSRNGAKEPELKRDLATDLAALVNTINLHSVIELDELPRVKNSILNYGLDDIGHMTNLDHSLGTIADDLRAALLHHEPRIRQDTLDVNRMSTDDEVNTRVRFQVSAEMDAKPVPIPLEFTAELDVASGKVQLNKLAGV